MVVREAVQLQHRALELEIGRIARQADGAVVVSSGDTKILVTAQMDRSPKKIPFLPLTVDYREYSYAGGRIPGGFFKREGRPTDKETLTARMTDRCLRPLFPKGYNYETQIIGLVLSADGENDPGVLMINGASTALCCSVIPFSTHVAAVRVGLIENEYVVNPTATEMKESILDLVVAGRRDSVVMVEARADEVSEQQILDGFEFASEHIGNIIDAQERLVAQLAPQKREYEAAILEPAIVSRVEELKGTEIQEALGVGEKIARRDRMGQIKKELAEALAENADDDSVVEQGRQAFEALVKTYTRRSVLQEGRRQDGRSFDEIRPIHCEVSYSPRAHGSALFTRGETQAFVSVTLGTSDDAKKMENYEGEWWKKFYLHYSFPPFCVGEVRFMRGPGRREIGHGYLAEKAIEPVLPGEESFPYVIRGVSDILESNGSSSMASVCGATLALMDAGVPIRAPVAGIAMGLMKEGEEVAVLSDIAGEEDHHGDMDFKVAGTPGGITALQMDIKITGLAQEILSTALEQARQARIHVLRKMKEVIAAPRSEPSDYAPRIITIKIPVDRIRDIIGPGGRIIRNIQEVTGCKVNVEDDGSVQVASPDVRACDQARKMIEDLTQEAEVGKIYSGKVRSIKDFGAFVEILPGTDGLLHISEIADHHVDDVRDHLQEGDELLVKVVKIEGPNRIRLSRKAMTAEEKAETVSQ